MKKTNIIQGYKRNQNIHFKKKRNTNNNMEGGMSYQRESFFCMEWCMQQLMDKFIK